MEGQVNNEQQEATSPADEVRTAVREAMQEFVASEQSKAEPAYRTELAEERRRREHLEKRVNELVQENERSRQIAEEAERHSSIREELQRLGVAKVDLGFRAVKDDIFRAPDGQLMARTGQGEMRMQEYLAHFAAENPELLPARIPGGSGAPAQIAKGYGGTIDLNRIKPGMDREELARVRQEIAQAISQSYGNE